LEVEEKGRRHFQSSKQIPTKLSRKTIASFFGGSTNHNVLVQDEKRPRIEEGAGCSKPISDGALQKSKGFSASLQSKQTDSVEEGPTPTTKSHSLIPLRGDSDSVSSQDVDMDGDMFCIKPPVFEKLGGFCKTSEP